MGCPALALTAHSRAWFATNYFDVSYDNEIEGQKAFLLPTGVA